MRIFCHSRVTITNGPGQTSTKRGPLQRRRIIASERAQKLARGRTTCSDEIEFKRPQRPDPHATATEAEAGVPTQSTTAEDPRRSPRTTSPSHRGGHGRAQCETPGANPSLDMRQLRSASVAHRPKNELGLDVEAIVDQAAACEESPLWRGCAKSWAQAESVTFRRHTSENCWTSVVGDTKALRTAWLSIIFVPPRAARSPLLKCMLIACAETAAQFSRVAVTIS